MIGIIGALTMEVELLTAALENRETAVISGITFNTGTLCGHRAVIAVSGAGKVNAAVCAQIMITVYHADRIINTGVAGGIASQLRQGDMVIASALVQHDMDTTGVGDPLGFISGIGMVEMPCDTATVDAVRAIADKASDYNTISGIVATGDQFIADKQKTAWLAERFNAVACEMEGGAIAQVCCMTGIPFAVLRCISDNADGSAGVSYAEFGAAAAKRSAQLLIDYVGGLD